MNEDRVSINGLYKSIDIACLFLIGTLGILALLFPGRIPCAMTIAASLFGVGALFMAGSQFIRRMPEGFLATIIRTAGVVSLFSFLDSTMKNYQMLLFPRWMDQYIVALEHSLFGTDVASVVSQFSNRYLTEGLMYSYVAYCPLLPLVALMCYRSNGLRGAHDYLLNLSATFAVCFLGFMLFPLASPSFFSPSESTMTLDGGFFTWCANWIHANHHYPGGSLPSPHCAGTTIMLIFLYRYDRKAFYVLMPTLVLVYAATVYGRFHYVWDGIAGVSVAAMVVRITPSVSKWADVVRTQSVNWGTLLPVRAGFSMTRARAIVIIIAVVVTSARAQGQEVTSEIHSADLSIVSVAELHVTARGKKAMTPTPPQPTDVDGIRIPGWAALPIDRLIGGSRGSGMGDDKRQCNDMACGRMMTRFHVSGSVSRGKARLGEQKPVGTPNRALICFLNSVARLGFPRIHSEPHFADRSPVSFVDLIQLVF